MPTKWERLNKRTARNILHIPGARRNHVIGWGGIAVRTIHVKPVISKFG